MQGATVKIPWKGSSPIGTCTGGVLRARRGTPPGKSPLEGKRSGEREIGLDRTVLPCTRLDRGRVARPGGSFAVCGAFDADRRATSGLWDALLRETRRRSSPPCPLLPSKASFEGAFRVRKRRAVSLRDRVDARSPGELGAGRRPEFRSNGDRRFRARPRFLAGRAARRVPAGHSRRRFRSASARRPLP